MGDVAHEVVAQAVHFFQHGIFLRRGKLPALGVVQLLGSPGKVDRQRQGIAKGQQDHGIGPEIENMGEVCSPFNAVDRQCQRRREGDDPAVCLPELPSTPRAAQQSDDGQQHIANQYASGGHEILRIKRRGRSDIKDTQRAQHGPGHDGKPPLRPVLQGGKRKEQDEDEIVDVQQQLDLVLQVPVERGEKDHDLLALIDEIVRCRTQARQGEPEHPQIGRAEEEHAEEKQRHAKQRADQQPVAERLRPDSPGDDLLLGKEELLERAVLVIQPGVLDDELCLRLRRREINGVEIRPRRERSRVGADVAQLGEQHAVDIDPLGVGRRLAGDTVGHARAQGEGDAAGFIICAGLPVGSPGDNIRRGEQRAGVDRRCAGIQADVVLGQVCFGDVRRGGGGFVFWHRRHNHQIKKRGDKDEKQQNPP